MTIGVFIAIALLVPLGWAAWQQQRYQSHVLGMREGLRELREEVALLHRQIEAQHAAHAELAERLDFAERTLVQVKESRTLPPTGRS